MKCRWISSSPALVLFLVLECAVILGGVDSAQAQPEGLSYTFSPTYNTVRWNERVGLEDTQLYGGRLGISFGRMVALQGFYLTRNDVRTRLAKLDLPGAGSPLTDRNLDISNYGVDVTLSLGAGRAVPFLRGGGGILRFNPAEGDAIRQIDMKAGGGLRLGFRHFQAEVFAEDTAFRLDRFQLAEPPAAGSYLADPDAETIRHSLSMGAGLTFFLGGARESNLSETDRALLERYQHGLSGVSIPVEPFVGRLDFHNALGIDNQYLAGLRTGFDFGRFFGLRGYYWRGVNDGFDKTVPVQSWGTEARFNFNSGQGAVPYLLTGVGQLDFMKAFRDKTGVVPDDKTMLILGGGLAFRLSDRFEMDLTARDHILSAKALSDTSKPDDLLSNWMFGAALRFSLGGSSPQGQKPLFGKAEGPSSEPLRSLVEMEPEETDTSGTVDEGSSDSVRTVTGYASEHTITIPVPTEGEIYIRYGSPGGVSIGSGNVTRESAAPDAPPSSPAPLVIVPAPPAPPAAGTAPDLDTIRRVIREELRRAGVVRESGEDTPEARWVEEGKERPSESRRVVIEGRGAEATEEGGGGFKPVGFRLYTGLGMDDPGEVILGGRMNLGPITRASHFLFIPEVALGLGSDITTILVAGNLQLPLGNLGGSRQWRPYVLAGLGLLNVDSGGKGGTDLTVNFGLGVDARLGNWVPFLEYQGIRGFDWNRLLVGVRFRQ